MTATSVTLFIDTNGFIHLRDLKDLPWQEKFPTAKRIDIMIASRVIEELDDFKTGPNSRKRDRARLALKLIEKASMAADLALSLRTDPIEVRIVVASGPRVDWSSLPKLDPTKPDDQLVAEAVKHGSGAAVFSHDSGPRIRARIAGIQAVEPPQDWFLPDEKSDDQRKIRRLEQELEKAKSTFPRILVRFDALESESTDMEFYVPILPRLEGPVVDRLAGAHIAKNPRIHISPREHEHWAADFGLGDGYSKYDVDTYNQSYESFKEATHLYFSRLHENIKTLAPVLRIGYVIENDSGVSAKGLRIEASLAGEATLLADEDDIESVVRSVTPPKPPAKPKSSRFPSPDLSHISALQSANKPRDPTGFYWFERPKYGSTHSAMQCEDFRATRCLKDCIIIWICGSLPFSGRVTLDVSATNLPAPVQASAKFSMIERDADWSDEAVLAMLPEHVRKVLS